MGPFVELEGGKSVLAVDDEEFLFRILKAAKGVAFVQGLETQSLWREQQHGARNGRLAHGRLVKVSDRLDLGPRQRALEGFVASFDAGDELADIVLGLDFLRFDGFAFVVKPADEPHLGQEVFRRISDKVEDCILLSNLRRCHYDAFR